MPFENILYDTWLLCPGDVRDDTTLLIELVWGHLMHHLSTPEVFLSWSDESPRRMRGTLVNTAANFPLIPPSCALRAMLIVISMKDTLKDGVAYGLDAEILWQMAFKSIASRHDRTFTHAAFTTITDDFYVGTKMATLPENLEAYVVKSLSKEEKPMFDATILNLQRFYFAPWFPGVTAEQLRIISETLESVAMPSHSLIKPQVPSRVEQTLVFPDSRRRERLVSITEEIEIVGDELDSTEEEDELCGRHSHSPDLSVSRSPSPEMEASTSASSASSDHSLFSEALPSFTSSASSSSVSSASSGMDQNDESYEHGRGTGSSPVCALAEDYGQITELSAYAQEEVLGSMDILPTIFNHLKDQLQLEVLECANVLRWQTAFYTVVLTSRSFFEAGIPTLWHTMESFEACLRLLPWSQGTYKGLGVYEYSGVKDWERFSFYAWYIKRMKLAMECTASLEEGWLSELLALRERPDPIFPTLQSVDVASILSLPPTFLLLVTSESLRVLRLRVAAALVGPGILSIFPKMPQRSCNLTTIQFTGASTPQLFHHLAKIASLTSVSLSLLSDASPKDISLLRLLPNLRVLALEMKMGARVDFDPERPVPLKQMPLQGIFVGGSSTTQLSIFRALVPFAQHVDVVMSTVPDWDKMRVLLFHWLALSNLTLTIEVTGDAPGPSSGPSVLSSTEEADLMQVLMNTGRSLQRFTITDVPAQLGEPLSLHLQSHIMNWRYLKNLSYTIRPDDGLTGLYGRPYPDLSFLPSIRQRCPDLEELEFHFDDDACAYALSAPPPTDDASGPSSHPLRILRISTDIRDFHYSAQEKGKIANYLHRLFPCLEEVSGSARELWRDVDALVHSYQTFPTVILAHP
ncbi:hypothetical protein NMY22_g3572 [Coprinellus aureogranulatus]|nr:hypothetical protein NMY22_g3572 [Coprinellus aureogranulatus]